jgi:hypothetical protein
MSELPELSATERLMQKARIEEMERAMLEMPQVNAPVTERFAPGVYLREIFMPAGALIIGHEHRTEHFNIVLQGSALVAIDGVVEEIIAPATFVSKPGVRKVLLIIEDMIWQTVHPTTETDPAKLEDMLIVKSEGFQEVERQLQLLKEARK